MLTRVADHRPRIGICTALEHARWTVWDQEAFLLDRSYVDAVQAAGGLALMIPPDPQAAREPDEVLDLLDGLILAGGADIDAATYGEAPHAATQGTRRERDDFEVALARRALERDIPLLGICRGMQLMNVARGGTLIQHLPDDFGHEDHRRVPGSFDGADHDVRLADGSLAARAAGEARPRDQVPPPPGRRAARGGLRRDRLEHARRAARGDRGPRPPLRARRPVASRGRPGLAADRLARARGRGGAQRRPRLTGG